jgi:hypothetical protein
VVRSATAMKMVVFGDQRRVGWSPTIDASPRWAAAAASGHRMERAPERVLADVRSGNVSVAAAERDYGVVIRQSGAHGRRFEVDDERTATLRAQLRGVKLAAEAAQDQSRADDAH